MVNIIDQLDTDVNDFMSTINKIVTSIRFRLAQLRALKNNCKEKEITPPPTTPTPKSKENLINAPAPARTRTRIIFTKPSQEEIRAYCEERKNGIDAAQFYDFYESKKRKKDGAWMVGKNPMSDWKACIRTWERNRKNDVQFAPRRTNYKKYKMVQSILTPSTDQIKEAKEVIQ